MHGSGLRHPPGLVQQRIKESVMLLIGQQLPLAVSRQIYRQALRIRLLRHERCDDLFILLTKNRTSGVEQFSVLRQQLPQRLQNGKLLRGEAGNIGAAAQPLDVGVAAHHAGSRAGHIGKNALKWLPVPPLLRLRGITDHQTRR